MANERPLHESIHEAMDDWSGTGRGSHVEFSLDETVPLQQGTGTHNLHLSPADVKPGRFLGRGAMGDVHETRVRGYCLAWKKIIVPRRISSNERKEIEVLKKVSHTHVIRLVGTYTHQRHFGILLYPVALCDLHTFFEDVEAYWTKDSDDAQKARLDALDYLKTPGPSGKAFPIYSQIGCLISAIAYLHSQKVRHKDLKPSNILLSPGHLYLSDFGSATDFSLLSQSATDNERGTPRYFAPEVAEWKKSGRAADIFSLGCVLLEILVLHQDGTLDRLRVDRSTRNPAFHANLENIDAWLPTKHPDDMSFCDFHLTKAIRSMLSQTPEKRPRVDQLLDNMRLADMMKDSTHSSFFEACCRTPYVSMSFHTKAMRSLNDSWGRAEQELKSKSIELQTAQKACKNAQAEKRSIEAERNDLSKSYSLLSEKHSIIVGQLEAEVEALKMSATASVLQQDSRKLEMEPKSSQSTGGVDDPALKPDMNGRPSAKHQVVYERPLSKTESLNPPPVQQTLEPWTISPSEKDTSDYLFRTIDTENQGYISGL
ncbi:hypothetical protein OPT61_g10225 [Boeremia exigua]|uniref:Uncharacterized protein n=1 Tax=Boeremia exigua TaxID=749465 RepID=A0ACC2HRL5_9PLEO|nr:hypothetical protein OPT61_g10225 [Boeremia exigua]